jgi:hypothetical protein
MAGNVAFGTASPSRVNSSSLRARSGAEKNFSFPVRRGELAWFVRRIPRRAPQCTDWNVTGILHHGFGSGKAHFLARTPTHVLYPPWGPRPARGSGTPFFWLRSTSGPRCQAGVVPFFRPVLTQNKNTFLSSLFLFSCSEGAGKSFCDAV